MESTDLQVLRQASCWLGSGRRVILATVARTWGSSPRPVGSLLAVRADGERVGSVSGGCVEEHLIERLRAQWPERPEVATYGMTRDEALRLGLPCGGCLELVLEPLSEPDSLEPVLSALNHRELVARRLDIRSGKVEVTPAKRDDTCSFDGLHLTTAHGPAWRLLIIGAGQLSRYLAEMALTLDYHVIACDPRTEISWNLPGTDLDRRMPDDAVRAWATDQRSAVVALTHDPRLDDMALMEALESAAFYVGALGSKANNAKRRERLRVLGLATAAVARLHGPVGLPIGSRTPPEIAIAILAEMTAVRRGIILSIAPSATRDAASSRAACSPAG